MAAMLPVLATSMLLAASSTPGAPQHFDPFVQKPATSPLGLFTLEGAEVGDGLEWAGLRADYGHGLLALQNSSTGAKLGDVIPNRYDLHLLASVGWKRIVELGVDVPFTLHQQDGFDVARNLLRRAGVPEATVLARFPRLDSAGLNDVRLVPKVALPLPGPVHLAVIPELRFRTGDDGSFLGDTNGPIQGHAGPIFAPRVEGEGTIWRLRIVGEAGYQLRGNDQFYNLSVGDTFTFGAGADLALPHVRALNSWEAIAELNGETQVKKPFTFSQSDTYETPIELVGGLRARLHHGVLVYGGVGSGLSGGGYGRELFRAFLAVGWEPPEAVVGDPIPQDEIDSDGDGVPDGMDRCPKASGGLETDGCPDSDGDGIPDIDDRCPNEPGPAEAMGCRVDQPIVVYAPPMLSLNAGINFETGSATIKQESLPTVDAVADFLKKNPQLKLVRVEGHTDNRGSAKINLELSRRRAKSVMERLITDGIAPERLGSEGYGFEKPIASNATALGRAKNRRVEFNVLDPPSGLTPGGHDEVAKPPAPTPTPPAAPTPPAK